MIQSRKNAIIIATALLILSFGALFWMKTAQERIETPSFGVVAGDTIASWDWQGPYADGGAFEAKARGEITRLEALFGNPEGEPTDYILHVSIANQHHLLGDGEAEFASLNRAIAIDSTTTGLAWRNMGALMEKLGALGSARIAYAKAIEAQVQIIEYHTTYISFLLKHFSADTNAIETAFVKAEAEFDNPPEIAQLRGSFLR